MFVKRFFSTARALKRTNNYFFDPSFVLERDKKMELFGKNNNVLALQEITDEHFYVNYTLDNDNNLTNKSNFWENELKNEYWYKYMNKYYIDDYYLKPHGVINNNFYKKTYYDIDEFKYNVDKLFFDL